MTGAAALLAAAALACLALGPAGGGATQPVGQRGLEPDAEMRRGEDVSGGAARHRFVRSCLLEHAPRHLGIRRRSVRRADQSFCAAFRQSRSAEAEEAVAAAQRTFTPRQEMEMVLSEGAVRRAPRSPRFVEVGAATGTTTREEWLWPGNRIDYCIADSLTIQGEVALAFGVLHIEARSSCVRFNLVECPALARGIRVEYEAERCSGQGFYYPTEPVNVLNLCNRCGPGNAAHELLHVLGFMHTHSRTDRDTYIQINRAAVDLDDDAFETNFAAHEQGLHNRGRFDFGSIMMYNAAAFERDGNTGPKPIVERTPRPTGDQAARYAGSATSWDGRRQRLALSQGDVVALDSGYCVGVERPTERDHDRFERLVEMATRGIEGVRVSEATRGRRRMHIVRCPQHRAPAVYFWNELRGSDRIWSWSFGSGPWTRVPGMMAVGGGRDGQSPPECALRVIEQLAHQTQRVPAPLDLTNHETELAEHRVAHIESVEEIERDAAEGEKMYRVSCSMASAHGGCNRVAYYKVDIRRFWYWSHSTGEDTFRRVAAWDGRACDCHNALNAALSVRLGGPMGIDDHHPAPTPPASAWLAPRQCLYIVDRRQKWVPGHGDCEDRSNGLTCNGNSANCGPTASQGCRGRCACGRNNVDECRCLRPVDRQSERCQSVEEA